MRVARTSPLCVAGRGEDRLLHLYRRLVQPGATAFCPRLPLAHGLRTGDGGPTNGSVINQARQHSTKTGQLQTDLLKLSTIRRCRSASVCAICRISAIAAAMMTPIAVTNVARGAISSRLE